MLVETPSSSLQPETTNVLLQTAQEWARRDPNQVTAAHVRQLIQQESIQGLQSLFPADNSRISFGTAGLRAAMKPGPLGMNDLVVVQTAQGLVRYCEQQQQQQHATQQQKLCAVIGYDHRANSTLQLSSLSFALLTALVFMQAGWDCLLLDGLVVTPLVPFALGHLQKQQQAAVIGIMITASHNPKQDAGYKVYWKDGCQIRSPTDQGIARSIMQNLEPWIDYGHKIQELRQSHPNDPCLGLSRKSDTQQIISVYYSALEQSGLIQGVARDLSTGAFGQEWKPPRFCYTAMHGVGYRFARQAFETFQLPPFVSVPSQQEPNPLFPSVAFPNPEEKGALDIAQQYAQDHDCDIILAHDPDADRLAVAEKNRQNEWTVFTGDQIGSMLGLWLWERVGMKQPKPIAMCASTVSSQLLAEIARVQGFYFQDTLTGFKWIGSRALQLHQSGYRTLFCYEEAIGFCCGDVIFDKDGISAAAVFAELAIAVYRQGKTLTEHMQSIYDKYGEFVSNNGYYFIPDHANVLEMMNGMSPVPGDFSKLDTVGPYKVQSIRYLGEPGYDSSTPDHQPILPTSKSSPMITIRFENGCVAQFRASGTEPKFKYYIELKGEPGVSRDQVQSDLMKMSDTILETLLQPSKNGLIMP